MTSTRAALSDPLATLPVAPDGAVTWRLDASGRWRRTGAGKPPTLRGRKGVWHGYTPENDWLHSFGWPNDHEAFRRDVLYKADKVVGELWYFRFPSRPDLTVLFVYTSLEHNPDAAGEHDGHHKFVWYGELR